MKNTIIGMMHDKLYVNRCSYCKHFESLEVVYETIRDYSWVDFDGYCTYYPPTKDAEKHTGNSEWSGVARTSQPMVSGMNKCSKHKLNKKLIKLFLDKAYLKEF
jgi:hypothetical protein